MNWLNRIGEGVKRGIRNWLNVNSYSAQNLQIQQTMDFELNAIRNRIWYRGDGNELEQLYQQLNEYADKYKFWACRSTRGMEIRKIHTGLPGLIVRTLTGIILPDMHDFDFKDAAQEGLWGDMDRENGIKKLISRALAEVLFIGDGAFKVTIDTEISQYPILEWYSGEKIELVRHHGRLKEIVFKTAYHEDHHQYALYEHYGYGYVTYELFKGDQKIEVTALKVTANLVDYQFDKSAILAVPLMIYDSAKWDGRGSSIFSNKLDNFDALDEAWSQWMDALRAGRAKDYVPESCIPRDPDTGKLMRPNPFDMRFIVGDDNMEEKGKNVITSVQPDIPHDSYLAAYVTALDICLQGIISPSTLGIDTKKLDNAEAQREKEKTTLYTRDAIVEALQETLPQVISACFAAYYMLHKQMPKPVGVTIPFGEYANPSFESQVETIGKAKTQGIMSIEAVIDELYGDTKEEKWKEEEIQRLKAEQGIAEMAEPGIGLNLEGVQVESANIEQDVPDVKGAVQGVAKNSI